MTSNLPLIDTTGAWYQTLSSQVASDAESFDFLSSALDLARAGIADADATTKQLAGKRNAFDLHASDAELVASKLFGTVEEGITTISELNSSLVRAIPTASSLGVSLDELLASFAILTQRSLPTRQAVTALDGATASFLKPTQETSRISPLAARRTAIEFVCESRAASC